MENFRFSMIHHLGLYSILLLLLASPPVRSQLQVSDFAYLNDVLVDKIMKNFDKAVKDFFNNTVRTDLVNEALDKLKFEVKTVKGQKLEDDFTSGIESVFNGTKAALNNIRDKAETAEMNHDYTVKREADRYFNMRDISEHYNINDSVRIMPEFSDTVPVNLTNSFVQVPTNVFAYKKTVLDQITWGQKIDKSFIENYSNLSDGKLLYQFYGDSATGNIWRPSRQICRKSSVEECIFDFKASHIECRFNKNSLL